MNKQNKLLYQVLTHAAAIIVFLVITLTYFSPTFQGKILPQSDVQQYQGASQEIREYHDKEGTTSTWTGSMFSGMPTYQIAVFGGSPNFLDYVEKPFKALGDRTAGPVFAGMVMAYILFCVMGFKPTISIIGAIAFSLSSYNIIILDAGHVTKAWAIAYMPLVIAGFVMLYQKKYLIGGIVMALALALEVKSNHLQMTYYLAILCAIIYIGLFIDLIRKSELKSFLKMTGVLSFVVIISVLSNLGNFYANYEMSKESTRGKSELTAPSTAEKQSSGLDKDYVFGWSYGIGETFSLMIPNIHGGASGGLLNKSSNLAKALTDNGHTDQITPEGVRSYTYWGDQPFTSGPVYIGAIICFLFVLGMLIIPNKAKWILFVGTVFFIFLAWGRNMEWFNDFFFYHFPMYSKFRAVSSALVIPALTMLIIAIWGLNEFVSDAIDKAKRTKALYISAGVVGGFALLFWLMPGFSFNFIAESDAAWSAKMPDWYYKALLLDRKDLLSSDALRSLILVLLAASVLWVSINTQISKKSLAIAAPLAIALLVLIDLWGVDSRYLNDTHFVDKNQYKSQSFSQSNADKFILQDKNPSYRVLNVVGQTDAFADAQTSYYHKSIGGYHAAKLKRYQELIDSRLRRESGFIQNAANTQLQIEIAKMQEAQKAGVEVNPESIYKAMQDSISPLFGATMMLNSLNAKYIVYHPELPPVVNPVAFGNAWFVDEYKMVNNADEEIASLENLNTLQTAVVDKRFEQELAGLTIKEDSLATIEMTAYKPDRVKYVSEARSEQLVVFSEIYYDKGWQAYVDGVAVPHLRADYTLRAMRVPAGKHEVEFVFEPKTYNTCRMVTTASSGLLVLLLLGTMVWGIAGAMKQKEN